MGRPVTRVCFPFVGDTIGGSHISALTLVRGLDPEHFLPLVVVHEEGPLSAYLKASGLPYRMLPLPRYVGRDTRVLGHGAAILRSSPPVRRFLRRERIALVHSHDARMHLTWSLPARLAGAKVVWHQRSAFTASRLDATMLRLPTRIIAISEFVAQSLPPTGQRKSRIIDNPFEAPPALDRDDCRRRLLAELGEPNDTGIVGFFGNLIDWKRPLRFVEAAAEIARALDRRVVFPVFGEDREALRPDMEALAEQNGIADRLVFMGFRQPVWPWITGCEIILAPSVGEPFGRTLVEAMLSGTAIVAADSGGHKEILRDDETGFLVAPDDAAAMAAAAIRLLRDERLRNDLAQTGRTAARQRFGLRGHVEAVEDLYREILTGD